MERRELRIDEMGGGEMGWDRRRMEWEVWVGVRWNSTV